MITKYLVLASFEPVASYARISSNSQSLMELS